MFSNELDTVKKHNMIQKGDRIIIALSGGCDSVYLLYFFNSIKEEFDLTLCACHLNHSIRGEEAVRDMEFSKNLAQSHGIEFFTKTVDVPKLAHEKGFSLEEAGRVARYEFFDTLAKELGGAKIATAHHLDDNAETVLMHLIRGCGIKGLCGIAPVRDNIIRPLISTKKEDIISYLDDNAIAYVTDSTNNENDYSRNSIRNELIPFIKEKYNPNFTSALNTLSNIAQQTFSYTEASVSEDVKISRDENGVFCSICDILKYPLEISSYVFRQQILLLSGKAYDFSITDYENIYSLCKNATSGKKVILPHKIICMVIYDRLYFCEEKAPVGFEYQFKAGDTVYVKEAGITLKTEFSKPEKGDGIVCLNCTENDILTVRNRRSGDSFVPDGMCGHKKLKNYFIDLKIPLIERDRVPVFVKDGVIVAVSTRVAQGYSTDKTEGNVLKIKIIKTRD